MKKHKIINSLCIIVFLFCCVLIYAQRYRLFAPEEILVEKASMIIDSKIIDMQVTKITGHKIDSSKLSCPQFRENRGYLITTYAVTADNNYLMGLTSEKKVFFSSAPLWENGFCYILNDEDSEYFINKYNNLLNTSKDANVDISKYKISLPGTPGF